MSILAFLKRTPKPDLKPDKAPITEADRLHKIEQHLTAINGMLHQLPRKYRVWSTKDDMTGIHQLKLVEMSYQTKPVKSA